MSQALVPGGGARDGSGIRMEDCSGRPIQSTTACGKRQRRSQIIEKAPSKRRMSHNTQTTHKASLVFNIVCSRPCYISAALQQPSFCHQNGPSHLPVAESLGPDRHDHSVRTHWIALLPAPSTTSSQIPRQSCPSSCYHGEATLGC